MKASQSILSAMRMFLVLFHLVLLRLSVLTLQVRPASSEEFEEIEQSLPLKGVGLKCSVVGEAPFMKLSSLVS